MNRLKEFLDEVSGKKLDDLIDSLDVEPLNVLMSLPGFDSEDGLSEHDMNFTDTLGKKGYKIDDPSIEDLFNKGCLKWNMENKTFAVHQSLCGKKSKDALVERYINLKRGGDGSDSFRWMFEGES